MTAPDLIQLFGSGPALRVFEAVARQLDAGDIEGRESAVREVVRRILHQAMPELEDDSREALVPRIAEVLMDEPVMASRINRLLGFET